MHDVARWCNTEHCNSAICFVTPDQRHHEEDPSIPAQRHSVHQAARDKNPARWSGKTRNWESIEVVSLSPERKPERTPAKKAA
ncbi:MAG: hypothetical protein AADX96_23345 [Thiocapsa sp. C3-sup]|uniref:hypothetical protein n=1 Tax=Thiocapsa sp. C3-sup TaxID=3137396 RepID=UPI0035AFA2D6